MLRRESGHKQHRQGCQKHSDVHQTGASALPLEAGGECGVPGPLSPCPRHPLSSPTVLPHGERRGRLRQQEMLFEASWLGAGPLVFPEDTHWPASLCSPLLPPCLGLLLHGQRRVIFRGAPKASSSSGSTAGPVSLSHGSIARAHWAARALGQIQLNPCSDRGGGSPLEPGVSAQGWGWGSSPSAWSTAASQEHPREGLTYLHLLVGTEAQSGWAWAVDARLTDLLHRQPRSSTVWQGAGQGDWVLLGLQSKTPAKLSSQQGPHPLQESPPLNKTSLRAMGCPSLPSTGAAPALMPASGPEGPELLNPAMPLLAKGR